MHLSEGRHLEGESGDVNWERRETRDVSAESWPKRWLIYLMGKVRLGKTN